MKKSLGFTLAEVLITLGIIGVVAAMTMPTLINSTQGAQYKAAFKKALSALSQAVTLNVALDEWDFADVTNSGDYTIANILKDRMNVVRGPETGTIDDYVLNGIDGTTVTAIDGVAAPGADNTTVFFNDGIMFSYKAGDAKLCSKNTDVAGVAKWSVDQQRKCSGFVDVNGIKGPNKVVVCDKEKTGKSEDCIVSNPTDIYPVMFYDSTVLPSTNAGRAVLYGK